MNYCERTGVWAAFCERSYEGIGFNEDGIVQGKAKADVRRYYFYVNYTNKNAIYAIFA